MLQLPNLPLPPSVSMRVLAKAVLRLAGGPGSGNFGHAGRPGQVGGSAPSLSAGAISSISKEQRKDIERRLKEDLRYVERENKAGEELEKQGVRLEGGLERTILAKWGAKNADEYVEKVEERLRDATKDAKIYVRMNLTDLNGVLRDGEIQNAFQSGRSHGGTTASGRIDYARRVAVDEMLFGIPKDAPGEARPKYGYLASGDGFQDMGTRLKGAGSVAVELKPHVRSRTTFTVGDSLDNAVTLMPEMLGGGWMKNAAFVPQPVDSPSILAVPGGTAIRPNFTPESLSYEYLEAQIHGRIGLKDIKSVTFVNKPSSRLVARLNKLGIKAKTTRAKKFRSAGGPGSGNFGHAGRPGQVGGSATAGFVPATAEQRRALKLPPAWTDVLVNPDPEGALQAVGKDAKGRTQYRYSAAHSEAAAAKKFARMKNFEKALPILREKVARDLESDDPNVRETALVIDLIDKTGFRVGGEGDTGADKKAYGATTLLAKHVKVAEDKVRFSFTAKKGVDIRKTVTDVRLARHLELKLEDKRPSQKLFSVSANDVRDYMDANVPGFTPKDFRTRHATAMALALVQKLPKPRNAKDLKKARRRVGEKVADFLGNTHTVALSSYIDPTVFAKWEASQ